MSTFVKLTHKNGTAVWVNPAFVETVLTAGGSTRLFMTGTSGRIEVQEDINAVMQALGTEVPAEEPAPTDTSPTVKGRSERKRRSAGKRETYRAPRR